MSSVTVCNCPQNTPDPDVFWHVSSRPSDQIVSVDNFTTCTGYILQRVGFLRCKPYATPNLLLVMNVDCGANKISRNLSVSWFLPRDALVIACRPSVCLSVCPSVTLVDQDPIGWKSWKLIAPSPTPSLFVAQKPSTYSQRNRGKFDDTRGGVGEKWRAGAQKRQYL